MTRNGKYLLALRALPQKLRKGRTWTRNQKYLFALLAIGLVVRLVPAFFVYGSFDVGAWNMVVRTFHIGSNPYESNKLNWPPLWPMLLYLGWQLENLYDLPSQFGVNLPDVPPHFMVKMIPCIADAAIGLVLFQWFARTARDPAAAFQRALCYALNPVAIATCALHGQFESLPSLFSLLAVAAVPQSDAVPRTGWARYRAALWLSLGGMAKTWPLVLLPAFLRNEHPYGRPLSGRTWWERITFASIAVAPAAVSVFILYLFAPAAIVRNVLNYHSSAGLWGLTAFDYALPAKVADVWPKVVMAMLCAAWLAVFGLTWRRASTGQIALLSILTFYVFTPGWGVQYLAWCLAIALAVDFRRASIFTVIGGVCLAIMYAYWPYNGEHFDFHKPLTSSAFLSHRHTEHFWATYLAPAAFGGNALVFLPLWLYCIAWWATLLRDALKQPARAIDAVPQAAPDEPQATNDEPSATNDEPSSNAI